MPHRPAASSQSTRAAHRPEPDDGVPQRRVAAAVAGHVRPRARRRQPPSAPRGPRPPDRAVHPREPLPGGRRRRVGGRRGVPGPGAGGGGGPRAPEPHGPAGHPEPRGDRHRPGRGRGDALAGRVPGGPVPGRQPPEPAQRRVQDQRRDPQSVRHHPPAHACRCAPVPSALAPCRALGDAPGLSGPTRRAARLATSVCHVRRDPKEPDLTESDTECDCFLLSLAATGADINEWHMTRG